MGAEKDRSLPAKDLALVIAVAVGSTLILVNVDAFEWFHRYSRRFERYDLDEIGAFFLVLAAGLAWFSQRRTREAKFELEERRRAELALGELNQQLENRVEQRTARLQQELSERKRIEKELINHQGRLRALSTELTLTEEREKRRIATDLHDHLGHSLALAKNKLGILRGTFPPDLARELEEVKHLIEQSIQNTRSLIFEVSPPILENFPFEASVEWLGENILEKNGVSFHLTAEGNSMPMEAATRVLVLKAIRELLVNIVKHAKAQNVEISVREKAGHMEVEIRDDGIGFEAPINFSALQKQPGFGLFSVQERLQYLKGSFSISSKPRQGTRVRLTVPTAGEK